MRKGRWLVACVYNDGCSAHGHILIRIALASILMMKFGAEKSVWISSKSERSGNNMLEHRLSQLGSQNPMQKTARGTQNPVRGRSQGKQRKIW